MKKAVIIKNSNGSKKKEDAGGGGGGAIQGSWARGGPAIPSTQQQASTTSGGTVSVSIPKTSAASSGWGSKPSPAAMTFPTLTDVVPASASATSSKSTTNATPSASAKPASTAPSPQSKTIASVVSSKPTAAQSANSAKVSNQTISNSSKSAAATAAASTSNSASAMASTSSASALIDTSHILHPFYTYPRERGRAQKVRPKPAHVYDSDADNAFYTKNVTTVGTLYPSGISAKVVTTNVPSVDKTQKTHRPGSIPLPPKTCLLLGDLLTTHLQNLESEEGVDKWVALFLTEACSQFPKNGAAPSVAAIAHFIECRERLIQALKIPFGNSAELPKHPRYVARICHMMNRQFEGFTDPIFMAVYGVVNSSVRECEQIAERDVSSGPPPALLGRESLTKKMWLIAYLTELNKFGMGLDRVVAMTQLGQRIVDTMTHASDFLTDEDFEIPSSLLASSASASAVNSTPASPAKGGGGATPTAPAKLTLLKKPPPQSIAMLTIQFLAKLFIKLLKEVGPFILRDYVNNKEANPRYRLGKIVNELDEAVRWTAFDAAEDEDLIESVFPEVVRLRLLHAIDQLIATLDKHLPPVPEFPAHLVEPEELHRLLHKIKTGAVKGGGGGGATATKASSIAPPPAAATTVISSNKTPPPAGAAAVGEEDGNEEVDNEQQEGYDEEGYEEEEYYYEEEEEAAAEEYEEYAEEGAYYEEGEAEEEAAEAEREREEDNPHEAMLSREDNNDDDDDDAFRPTADDEPFAGLDAVLKQLMIEPSGAGFADALDEVVAPSLGIGERQPSTVDFTSWGGLGGIESSSHPVGGSSSAPHPMAASSTSRHGKSVSGCGAAGAPSASNNVPTTITRNDSSRQASSVRGRGSSQVRPIGESDDEQHNGSHSHHQQQQQQRDYSFEDEVEDEFLRELSTRAADALIGDAKRTTLTATAAAFTPKSLAADPTQRIAAPPAFLDYTSVPSVAPPPYSPPLTSPSAMPPMPSLHQAYGASLTTPQSSPPLKSSSPTTISPGLQPTAPSHILAGVGMMGGSARPSPGLGVTMTTRHGPPPPLLVSSTTQTSAPPTPPAAALTAAAAPVPPAPISPTAVSPDMSLADVNHSASVQQQQQPSAASSIAARPKLASYIQSTTTTDKSPLEQLLRWLLFQHLSPSTIGDVVRTVRRLVAVVLNVAITVEKDPSALMGVHSAERDVAKGTSSQPARAVVKYPKIEPRDLMRGLIEASLFTSASLAHKQRYGHLRSDRIDDDDMDANCLTDEDATPVESVKKKMRFLSAVAWHFAASNSLRVEVDSSQPAKPLTAALSLIGEVFMDASQCQYDNLRLVARVLKIVSEMPFLTPHGFDQSLTNSQLLGKHIAGGVTYSLRYAIRCDLTAMSLNNHASRLKHAAEEEDSWEKFFNTRIQGEIKTGKKLLAAAGGGGAKKSGATPSLNLRNKEVDTQEVHARLRYYAELSRAGVVAFDEILTLLQEIILYYPNVGITGGASIDVPGVDHGARQTLRERVARLERDGAASSDDDDEDDGNDGDGGSDSDAAAYKNSSKPSLESVAAEYAGREGAARGGGSRRDEGGQNAGGLSAELAEIRNSAWVSKRDVKRLSADKQSSGAQLFNYFVANAAADEFSRIRFVCVVLETLMPCALIGAHTQNMRDANVMNMFGIGFPPKPAGNNTSSSSASTKVDYNARDENGNLLCDRLVLSPSHIQALERVLARFFLLIHSKGGIPSQSVGGGDDDGYVGTVAEDRTKTRYGTAEQVAGDNSLSSDRSLVLPFDLEAKLVDVLRTTSSVLFKLPPQLKNVKGQLQAYFFPKTRFDAELRFNQLTQNLWVLASQSLSQSYASSVASRGASSSSGLPPSLRAAMSPTAVILYHESLASEAYCEELIAAANFGANKSPFPVSPDDFGEVLAYIEDNSNGLRSGDLRLKAKQDEDAAFAALEATANAPALLSVGKNLIRKGMKPAAKAATTTTTTETAAPPAAVDVTAAPPAAAAGATAVAPTPAAAKEAASTPTASATPTTPSSAKASVKKKDKTSTPTAAAAATATTTAEAIIATPTPSVPSTPIAPNKAKREAATTAAPSTPSTPSAQKVQSAATIAADVAPSPSAASSFSSSGMVKADSNTSIGDAHAATASLLLGLADGAKLKLKKKKKGEDDLPLSSGSPTSPTSPEASTSSRKDLRAAAAQAIASAAAASTTTQQTASAPPTSSSSSVVVMVSNKAADEFKTKGNEAFANKRLKEAVAHYTDAIRLDKQQAVYYGNRAAAYIALGKFRKAYEDTKEAMRLDHSNTKYVYRCMQALAGLGRHFETLAIFESCTQRGALVIKADDEKHFSALVAASYEQCEADVKGAATAEKRCSLAISRATSLVNAGAHTFAYRFVQQAITASESGAATEVADLHALAELKARICDEITKCPMRSSAGSYAQISADAISVFPDNIRPLIDRNDRRLAVSNNDVANHLRLAEDYFKNASAVNVVGTCMEVARVFQAYEQAADTVRRYPTAVLSHMFLVKYLVALHLYDLACEACCYVLQYHLPEVTIAHGLVIDMATRAGRHSRIPCYTQMRKGGPKVRGLFKHIPNPMRSLKGERIECEEDGVGKYLNATGPRVEDLCQEDVGFFLAIQQVVSKMRIEDLDAEDEVVSPEYR